MDANFACLLENRGVIGLGGPDRHAFLQGLISNDIDLCTAARAIYAALLTPQGKFLHDLFMIEDGEEFLIDCEAARAEDLIKRLAAYKLRAKITLRDMRRQEFDVWADFSAFRGQARDPEILSTSASRMILWTPASAGEALLFMPIRDCRNFGFRAILKKENSQTPNPEPQTPFAVYDRHRLALGVADGSRDMLVEKSTLAEGNFDFLNGISWSKGCYVGQEITARMHYRGLVKKRMFPVKITGAAPAFGIPVITLGVEEIGDGVRRSAGDLGIAPCSMSKKPNWPAMRRKNRPYVRR